MKLKRAKAYKKLMGYLRLDFQFREPYQILVDEEIVLEAARTKYDLVAGLERTLQAQIKVMITQCTMEHLYRAKNAEAIELAKSLERRRCGHLPQHDATVSAYECIDGLVDVDGQNKHRYIVATQKPKLRQKLRSVPAVPLIYLHRAVMIMEPISPVTQQARKDIEQSKLTSGLNSVSHADDTATDPVKASTKPPKVKGPNPLSVKKRKRPGPEDNANESASGDSSGRKRRKRGKKKSAAAEGGNTPAGSNSPAQVETSA